VENDSFCQLIDQFTRRLCYFIGITSYRLIKVPKQKKKKANEEEEEIDQNHVV